MILPPDFEPLWTAPAAQAQDGGMWFVFHGNALLVADGDGHDRPTLPPAAFGAAPDTVRCIGLRGGRPLWAARSDGGDAPPGYRFERLRLLFDRLPDDLLAIAGRAWQLIEFDRTQRFCGACAAATESREAGRSRGCSRCGQTYYPRLSPAMMVLVKRDVPAGRELLLARSPRFPSGMYSALAGFVEPSESVEQCVHRETLEEVGVRLRDLHYFASQSWPFPDSLMIAFIADYDGGAIRPQPGEIEDARWFALDALPALPHRLSIARRLIAGAIAEVAPRHPLAAPM